MCTAEEASGPGPLLHSQALRYLDSVQWGRVVQQPRRRKTDVAHDRRAPHARACF
eukprot:CAMPEP_0175512024 /NCGR_PEP_ID=MMETSP0096-20121207/12198_1 /TAXON_ID=311494 /ORGANISM="Alexandrium monilatum, Strain CCMP3105" /LENGTH=54 /DNA_ID=CAMNT_0016814233 /DNA_START=284 /DNA_END=445 /DNA_ORIENTATION=+